MKKRHSPTFTNFELQMEMSYLLVLCLEIKNAYLVTTVLTKAEIFSSLHLFHRLRTTNTVVDTTAICATFFLCCIIKVFLTHHIPLFISNCCYCLSQVSGQHRLISLAQLKSFLKAFKSWSDSHKESYKKWNILVIVFLNNLETHYVEYFILR